MGGKWIRTFCNGHDILHRHRAPCEATRAKDAAPADEATRGAGVGWGARAASPSGEKTRCRATMGGDQRAGPGAPARSATRPGGVVRNRARQSLRSEDAMQRVEEMARPL